MLKFPALRRFLKIVSRISRGVAMKRDRLISASTEINLLYFERTSPPSSAFKSLRVRFLSGLPIVHRDRLDTPYFGAYSRKSICCFLIRSSSLGDGWTPEFDALRVDDEHKEAEHGELKYVRNSIGVLQLKNFDRKCPLGEIVPRHWVDNVLDVVVVDFPPS